MTATAEDLSAYREYVEGRIEDGDVDEGLLTFDQWLPTHIEAVREWDAAPPERAP